MKGKLLPQKNRLAKRTGKVLVIVAILFPTIIAMTGIVIDCGILMNAQRELQHAADAAATGVAIHKQQGGAVNQMNAVAQAIVKTDNGFADATVSMNSPPLSGLYVGSDKHLEVIVSRNAQIYFMPLLFGASTRTVSARGAAGCENSTAGAAVVVLDPDPDNLTIGTLPLLLPALPSLVGGVEILGLGSVEVDGAMLVNNEWGGKDEFGKPAGDGPGLPCAMACTPILPLTRIKARDYRIVGGVDSPNCYGNFLSGQPSPLKANRLPVPDPLRTLPPPTLASDPANVRANTYGGKTIVGIPLIGPPTILQPGVYEWIVVVSGKVIFQPGVYIIRSKDPITQLSLSVVAGEVTANGVMFYITDNAAYTPASGLPDSADGETKPANTLGTILPSVVIDAGLINSQFNGLNDPTSLYDGMLIFQRRKDRRPILLLQTQFLLGGGIDGTIYSKWGHVILSGQGTYKTAIVTGTLRFITVLDLKVKPTTLLPAATDVFLVE